MVGRNITLIKKQYGWLLPASAVITASPHSCVGYVNVLPNRKNFASHFRIPQAIVRFGITYEYFGNGSFARYSDLKIFFTCLSQACCKLQIVSFSDLRFYQFASSLPYIYLKYIITSEDLTSPSRFVIDFTSIGKMVELRNISSPHGLRIYTLDNHCRLVKDVPPYTEIWDTEAYSAQIGLHSSILTHAAGFSVKVGQGRKMPVCTDESGMNGSDIIFDVYLLGPCANANMNVQGVRFLVIHSIHRSRRCCRFDGYITMHPMGAVALSLKEARQFKGHVSNVWHTSYRDANVKFWVMCTHICLKIIIELHVDRSTLKTFSVGYQAKLIE